jgi:uncharacterized caspase-like protein
MSLRAKDPLDIFRKGLSRFWILLIGIDDYEDPALGHLNYAVADCRGIEQALDQATKGFLGKEKLIHCVGSLDPNRKNVLASLEQIARSAQKEDIVLIYFSGHGYVDHEQTYLCLTKTHLNNPSKESLALSELFHYLRRCSAKKQLVLVDACHSGDIQSLRSTQSQRQQTPATELVGAFDQYVKNTIIPGLGFYALLSCDRDQLSYEFSDLKHGVFTHFLIKGLEGEAADAGMIRPLQLFSYVLRRTQEYTEKEQLQQTPRIITNAATDFEIGIVQHQQEDRDLQQARQKQLEEYEKIYRNARRAGLPIQNETRADLRQTRQRLKLLREQTALQIEEDVNHLFQHCEDYIFQYIQSQSLPIQETCDGEVLSACRQELHLRNEDIAYIYLRIAREFNQRLKAYLQHITDILNQQGLEDESSLWTILPEGLSENNVAQARQSLIADYEKRLGDKIAQYEARVSSDLHRYDPIRLEHEANWEHLALSLNLSECTVRTIESQCKEAYYNKKITYQIEAKNTIQQYGKSINIDILLEQLQSHQTVLGLRNEVAASICEKQLLSYDDRCNQYTQTYNQSAKECYPIPEEIRTTLLQIKEFLGLHENDIALIETDINQELEKNLSQYRIELPNLVYALYPIDEATVSNVLEPELIKLQRRLDLGDRTVQTIKQNIIHEYRAALANYRQITHAWLMIKRKKIQDPDVIEALQAQRRFLRDDVITAIHKEVEQDVEQRRKQQQNERRTRLF